MVRLRCVLSFLTIASSFVISLPQTAPSEAKDPICNPISECTPEWFLQETKPEYAHTLVNRALFYSRDGGPAARSLSCDSKKFFVSIWQIWDSWMYDGTDPRLKYVYSTTALTDEYYKQMSIAFARMARGAATSLHQPVDYINPPTFGIFGRYEVPALGKHTDVAKLWKMKISPGGVFSIAGLDSAMADVGIYNGPAIYQAAANLVQKNMWQTEYHLNVSASRKHDDGFVDNDNFVVGPTCPFVPSNHPLYDLGPVR